jgi:hypothetical protein
MDATCLTVGRLMPSERVFFEPSIFVLLGPSLDPSWELREKWLLSLDLPDYRGLRTRPLACEKFHHHQGNIPYNIDEVESIDHS